jgi:frataxin-like iron-binding protein CyaY
VGLNYNGRLTSRNNIASLVPRFQQQATIASLSPLFIAPRARFYVHVHVQTRCLSSETKPFSRKRQPESATASSSSTLDFNQHAIVAMLQIYKTLSPLLEMNQGFQWTCSQLDVLKKVATEYGKDPTDTSVLNQLAYSDESLRLLFDVGVRGSYIFTVDRQQERVNVQSPISGTYSYAYDGEYWLSVMDGHDMRGLITRDLLRHCCGCPMF